MIDFDTEQLIRENAALKNEIKMLKAARTAQVTNFDLCEELQAQNDALRADIIATINENEGLKVKLARIEEWANLEGYGIANMSYGKAQQRVKEIL
jgi:hypothetical protein